MRTTKIKILVIVIVFFAAFMNFNISKKSRAIAGEKVNVTVMSLGNVAQAAGCDRVGLGNGNGYCTWGTGDGGYCAISHQTVDCARP